MGGPLRVELASSDRTSLCCSLSSLLEDTTDLVASDVVSYDPAASPEYFTCLGGGPNVDGSFSDASGRDRRS